MRARRVLWTSFALAVLLSVGGCVSGPDVVANRFVEAVQAGNLADAAGYVDPGLLGSHESGAIEQAAGSFSSASLGADARADYRLSEGGEGSAKVVSTSDSGDYMILVKHDGRWVIREIGRRDVREETESLDFERTQRDDSSIWQGESRVETEGRYGERAVQVTYDYVNGSEVSRTVDPGDVLTQPVTEVVLIGTKSRATGKIVTAKPASGDSEPYDRYGNEAMGANSECTFRVLSVTQRDRQVEIVAEVKNTGGEIIAPQVALTSGLGDYDPGPWGGYGFAVGTPTGWENHPGSGYRVFGEESGASRNIGEEKLRPGETGTYRFEVFFDHQWTDPKQVYIGFRWISYWESGFQAAHLRYQFYRMDHVWAAGPLPN